MAEYKLYLGDCLDILPTLEAESVDAVVTDPPYGTFDGRGKVTKRKDRMVSFNVGKWDKHLPLLWICHAIKILRDGCWYVIFSDKLSLNTVWEEAEKQGGNCKQTFYWIKNNPPPQPRKNFASGVESAVVGTRGSVKKWNGGGWYLNYFQSPLVTGAERTSHTTQKPIAVIKYLLMAITNEGDTVLDPFMGSGTTGVACMQTGRNFIGIEIDPDYYAIAEKRISDAAAQIRMPLEGV